MQRGSRFQGFTPEGERVLDWARRIVGDTRAMRQEIDALKRGLAGHIRIAAIPTALAMVAMLTTPYRAKHPDVSFTILSRNSIEVLGLLENLEVDAGLTYLDNEPLGRVQTVPLYSEHYRLLDLIRQPARRPRPGHLGRSRQGAALPAHPRHAEPAHHRAAAAAGRAPTWRRRWNRTRWSCCSRMSAPGRWASVMPAKLAEVLGLTEKVRAIPIVEPEVSHSIGLVVPHRNPLTPLINALVSEAKQLAPILGADTPTDSLRVKRAVKAPAR